MLYNKKGTLRISQISGIRIRRKNDFPVDKAYTLLILFKIMINSAYYIILAICSSLYLLIFGTIAFSAG